MKLQLFLFFLSTCFSTAVNSDDSFFKDSLKDGVESLSNLNAPIIRKTDCDSLVDLKKKIKCSEVTDLFCKKLWGDKNKGNIVVFDGEIRAGKSTKSKLWLTSLDDEKALINSILSMPNDMKKSLGLLVEGLSKHLENENSDQKWLKTYLGIKEKINTALLDLVNKRFDQKYGPLASKNKKNWSFEQSLDYKKELRNVQTELVIAKYAKDPNWLRVEKVFPQAKETLIKTIDSLSISEVLKEKLKTKVNAVKLILPINDPNKIIASAQCSKTELGAYYLNYTGNFTVCAGFFNAYRSDSAMITTIMHELAHAIDSENLARHEWRTNSLISKSLNQLNNQSNQSYQCSKWNKIKNEILLTEKDYKIVQSPLDNLFSCLRGPGKEVSLNNESINYASKQLVINLLGDKLESKKSFSILLEKKIKRNNVLFDNPIYFRPDLFVAESDGYIEENQIRDTAPSEVFMQNFYCILEENDLSNEKFEKVNKDLKEKLLSTALDQTYIILEKKYSDYFQYCGKNCKNLTKFNLTVNPQEKIADWFANKAFPLYLKTLSPKDQAEASALGSALFCTEEVEDTKKSKDENDDYPEDRHRRISTYTEELAKMVNCEIDEKDLGDSKCNP